MKFEKDVVVSAFVVLLRDCAKNKDLCTGSKVHHDISRRGLLEDCADALVTMYAKCGEIAKAKELFDAHKSRDAVTWTSLITGYVQTGHDMDALKCFEEMQQLGLSPDAATFTCILKACGNTGAAEKGEHLHDEIAKQGLLQNNIVLGNALVTMYTKSGALKKARQVLEELPARNVISWTALIVGYAEHGEGEQVLTCYERMEHEGLSPDATTFICILKACGSMKALNMGKRIHDEIAEQGILRENVLLGTVLVDMYARCGALAKAEQVLEEIPVQNVISWTVLIVGYVENGDYEQALNCYERMKCKGFSPTAVTFTSVLKACSSLKSVYKGAIIHDEITKQGLLGNDVVLGTTLVGMYAKCGALTEAHRVLEMLPVRNVVSWTALIIGYVDNGKGEKALDCYEQMLQECLCPNEVTFLCVVKACGSIGATEKGGKIHDEVAKKGLLRNNVALGTALVDMYAKCGALRKARSLLEELPVQGVAAWTAIIAGYAKHGDGEEALKCFEHMQNEGLSPDAATFTCALKACGSVGAIDKGEKIHHNIAKQGFVRNNVVLGTALVDMYAKCGDVAKAHRVLQELPVRNVMSWTALISGYADNGKGGQALDCFELMERDGLSPNAVTFLCCLKACGSAGAPDKGEEIHDKIAKHGFLTYDVVLGTALIDMYAKAGALARARQVLEKLPIRNVISWNALISGYVEHGDGAHALDSFERMQRDGLSPDAATFFGVLDACSCMGLIEDALMYFVNMSAKYGMKPECGHYICLVDLFGRAGHMDRALQVIEKMPSSANAVWSALLGACRKWGDMEVGRRAFEHAV